MFKANAPVHDGQILTDSKRDFAGDRVGRGLAGSRFFNRAVRPGRNRGVVRE